MQNGSWKSDMPLLNALRSFFASVLQDFRVDDVGCKEACVDRVFFDVSLQRARVNKDANACGCADSRKRNVQLSMCEDGLW